MNYNEGVIQSYNIKTPEIKSGQVPIHVDAGEAWDRVNNTENVYDNTHKNPVKNKDIVFCNGDLRNLIDYEDVQPDKYYYDMCSKVLYKQGKQGVSPWIDKDVTVIGVQGEPERVINVLLPTFDRSAYYYNLTVSNPEIWIWSPEIGWTSLGKLHMISGDPNVLYPVITGLDYKHYYLDTKSNTLYELDPFVFMEEIDFTSTWGNGDIIYEKVFEFYNQMSDHYIDINNEVRVPIKELFRTWGHPSKVKNPTEGRFYYDSKNEEYYQYKDGQYSHIQQVNKIIPSFLFY